MQQARRSACRTMPHSQWLDTPGDILARPLCTSVHAASNPTPSINEMRVRTRARAMRPRALTWRRRPAVTSREEGACLRGAIHYAWARLPETLSHYSDLGGRIGLLRTFLVNPTCRRSAPTWALVRGDHALCGRAILSARRSLTRLLVKRLGLAPGEAERRWRYGGTDGSAFFSCQPRRRTPVG
jgi:hypothetical protein